MSDSPPIAGSIDTAAPRELLAAIVVFDQFPRNLFRGTPRAFATDPIARRSPARPSTAASTATLAKRERIFVYLPFEHSEDAADQVRSVTLLGCAG